MKHLIKKNICASKVGQDVVDVLNNAPVDGSKLHELEETNMNEYYGLVQTSNNEIIQTFKYVQNDNVYLIPEPNPIVIYFDTAIVFHKQIKDRREQLFSETKRFGKNLYGSNSHFYEYYSTVSAAAVFLFLSIEALINKIIKPDFEYRRPVGKKKVELYNKYQIQREIEFFGKNQSSTSFGYRKELCC